MTQGAASEYTVASAGDPLTATGVTCVRGSFILRADVWNAPAGMISAIVGPNGAGKTTFMSLLAGRLHPAGGTIAYRNMPLDAFGHRLPEVIAYMPDTFVGFRDERVVHHLAFLARVYPRWDHSYCSRLLDALGIPTRSRIKTLSRGTIAKLSFVSCESSRPPVLLLDEPTSGLDPVVRGELLAILRDAVAVSPERAIILSTHLVEDVAQVAGAVTLVTNGQVTAPLSGSSLSAWKEAPAGPTFAELMNAFGPTSTSESGDAA